MSIRNLNWYNLQATRQYPLDAACTNESDDGQNLSSDILVDCHLKFDSRHGKYAYIQAVTVSENIVTVIIGASESIGASGKSIAALSVTKPASINVNYLVSGLVDGVAGWLVFGAGVDGPSTSLKFSSPRQSLLSARCAQPYDRLPITSIQKLNVTPALQNVVRIEVESPIKLEYKKEVSGSLTKQLLVFSLDSADSSLSYNPMSFFLGGCAQRPESNTCGKTPIATINGVAPDCFGNIKINFGNLTAKKFADCGGIDITADDYGFKKACEGAPKLPLFYSDLCCPMRFDDMTARDAFVEAAKNAEPNDPAYYEFQIGDIVRVGKSLGASVTPYVYYRVDAVSSGDVTWSAPLTENDANLKSALSKCDWPDPTEVIPDVVITLPSLQDYPEIDLPVCVDFCSCDPEPPLFKTIQGVFSAKRVKAPFGCVPCGDNPEAQPLSQDELLATRERNTYTSVDNGGTAISLFKNAASDWSFGRAISAQLRIEPTGLDRNGGLVINYRKIVRNGVTQVKYFVAAIDVSRGQFRLLDYTNNSYIVVAAVPYRVRTDRWYKIKVYPSLQGNYVYLNAVVEEMKANGTKAEIIDYRVSLADYEPQTGSFGLYAERSYTNFNAFTIT